MHGACRLACVLALARGAAALRARRTSRAPYRQRMINHNDVQYVTGISVGHQNLQGIVDTGSFDLVVFSKACKSCGNAAHYEETPSTVLVKGSRQQTHNYGSGSCTTQDLHDRVQVGPHISEHQAMWLAVECKMEILSSAAFNAIIGIAPPGQAEFLAKEKVDKIENVKSKYEQDGASVPHEISENARKAQQELAEAKTRTPLLKSLGAAVFSTCLERPPLSPGWMIWDDVPHEDRMGTVRLPVIGDITWSVLIHNVTLNDDVSDVPLGCEKGCGAIVDTGTSLFGMPGTVYSAIKNLIFERHLDCNDIKNFPDIIMRVGNHKLRFPPATYIGNLFGKLNHEAGHFLELNASERRASCQILLMNLGNQRTQYGPMFILGMPFFREYYTTFDLRGGRAKRSIYVNPAKDRCQPDYSPGSLLRVGQSRSERMGQIRQINASLLRPPHWLSRTDDSIQI